MSEPFEHQMQRADPIISSDDLARWSEIVNLLRNEIQHIGIGTLVRIAHPGLPAVEREERAFITAVRKKELSFKLKGNENIAAVVAGAALDDIMKSAEPEGLAAALIIRAIGFFKSPPSLVGLEEAAHQRILKEQTQARSRETIPKIMNQEIDGTAEDSDEEDDDSSRLRESVEQLQQSIAIQANVNELLSTQLRLRDEELELLWWAFGGRSISQRRLFSAMPAVERPLVSAYELSERLVVLPEPMSSDGLLRRALGVTEADTITQLGDVLTGTPEWLLKKVFAPLDDGLTSLLPMCALANHLTEATGISPVLGAEVSASFLEIARQGLYEFLALRAARGL